MCLQYRLKNDMEICMDLRAAEKFFNSYGVNAVLTDEAIKAVDPAKAAFNRQNQANCPFEVNRQYFTDIFIGVQPECKKVTETYWRIAHQFWLMRKLSCSILHTFDSFDQQKPLSIIPFLVYGEEEVNEELFADYIGPITSQELRLSTGCTHE